MNKTDIEWAEFTSNLVRGKCPVGCSYCYVDDFRRRFGWHEDIRFYPQELEAIRKRKKPARIFVGSTIELFHDKTIQYMPEILETARACPQQTLMFLTKQPQNLAPFSPFPDNCWVGVTVTNLDMARETCQVFAEIEASVKYLSFEPLLEPVPCKHLCSLADWIIIGAQTKPYKPPKIEWVREIVEAAEKVGLPVFLKDNLRPILPVEQWCRPTSSKLRQEMPV